MYGRHYGHSNTVDKYDNDSVLYNLTTVMSMTSPSRDCSLQATHLDECSLLSQNEASLIASVFGLMNIFVGPLGGLFSDISLKYYGLSGRILAHIICLTGEGVLLIVFSQMATVPAAICTLAVFSLFVQGSIASTFAIIPYVNPRRVGVIAGLIGSGGTAGGVLWNFIWSQLVEVDPSRWFWVLGLCVLSGSVLTLFIRVQDARIWRLRRRKLSDKVSTENVRNT